ncbi:hypothetical protein P3342_006512 [Pyrenophora teres f. teres]|uniref:Putative gamma-glutamylcyclotransferase n=1 Tax=Pyrenophora teres f. teres (strain 0-1) TaxID=861557 RepID=E3S219_PYRTT|nr:hypothetical protein PTT_16326 [Pyrenophora teres f. teres 0-1]KAE8833272.1 hypothetical protein HRS9139_05091 [Pyrenophora teres f. teres]KAE8840957.1 hypothetical protein PTNB85_04356 [Pyrenophora teres f. teres]KAE8848905.1 hypothetical protein HRS9122_02921 [Pyrenophora teres f. teres]KAE8864454.1 hypothetical protein PTNB29_04418 [Pyrenophora teres f. teres]
MDLLTELESLAQICDSASSSDVSPRDIARWHTLFNFNALQAEEEITCHRTNLNRIAISTEHWATVQVEQEALGHNQESYSYHLSHRAKASASPKPSTQLSTLSLAQQKRLLKKRWLLRLSHELATAEKIQEISHLPTPPRILLDEEDPTVSFVEVDIIAKEAIEKHMYPSSTHFIVHRVSAEKSLADTCIAPTLGLDATMPQHRLSVSDTPVPQQNMYPVPYFFYGTLAEEDRLVALLGLEGKPALTPAKVRRARVEMRGRYRGLVDGSEGDEVDGWMFVVGSERHEDALRGYEGDAYEVVRCEIFGEEGVGGMKGLTFRFCEEVVG